MAVDSGTGGGGFFGMGSQNDLVVFVMSALFVTTNTRVVQLSTMWFQNATCRFLDDEKCL